jgi:hypothetical protein
MFKGFTDVMVIHKGKECEEIKSRRHHLLTVLCTLTGVFLLSITINIFSSTLLSRQRILLWNSLCQPKSDGDVNFL